MNDNFIIAGIEFSESNYNYHMNQKTRHMGIDFANDPRSYVNGKGHSYDITGRPVFEFKWDGMLQGKPYEHSVLIAGDNQAEVEEHFKTHWGNYSKGASYRVEKRDDMFEYVNDFICVEDLCDQRMGIHINLWADWSYSKKVVVFGGTWSDVPDMPCDHFPSDEEIGAWLEKHPSMQYQDIMLEREVKKSEDFCNRLKSWMTD